MMMHIKTISFALVFLVAMGVHPIAAQVIPTPKEHFGFDIGADYSLANYTQAEAYFKKLAKISDRVLLREIGKTEEGRSQYIMVISAPANLKKIDRFKEISQKLARAENLTDAVAAKLAKDGKPVVWIDGGLHANETVATQQLIELYYQLLSRKDTETMRILDDVIILLSQVNPDGQELMSDWYMKDKDPAKRNMNIPRLYQKYIGHDNNRDFYMNNMKESTNISRQQYIEWMPQIVYNHHQTSPAGAVVAGPPYRDPFNFVYDPLLITGIDGVAASMINRLNAEGKPGYTRLSGSVYSTWWNGGLRTTPYFHNMIGILTEITGNPAPSEIPLVPERLVPDNATPFPVTPQKWNFRKSIDYSISLSYGILDYASRQGDQLLYNIYVMGRNAIQKGNQDTWTLSPKHIANIQTAFDNDKQAGLLKDSTGRNVTVIPMKYYDAVLKNRAHLDARAYIIPADQADFPTAVKFINALIKSGILVHQATADFDVEGKSYPAGSYVVKTNQAFRPHVMDMFEPQDHPNDFQYPGGPPVRPYDAAGWTLAFQMGVAFDRIVKGFEGPFEAIGYGQLQIPPAKNVASSATGYLLNTTVNNSFIVVNDLLKAGINVQRLTKAIGDLPAGSFYIPAKGRAILQMAGLEFGTDAMATSSSPKEMVKIAPRRIALFDRYGGSMPSGWVRWIMEQYHFNFQVIYPQDIDKGNLNSKFDVILLINDGIPAVGVKPSVQSREPKVEEIPEAYRAWLGSITPDKSIPALKAFMEKGGTVVTTGSNTNLAYHLNLPVKNALQEVKADGKEGALSPDKFYIPGSILKVQIDTNQATNYGMPAVVDMVFNNSPVFILTAGSTAQKIVPLAWFDQHDTLRSGWAWGQSYLKNGVAAFAAPVGKGKLYAFGPEITFRAQAHGTFKMLFNELYLSK
ncbi:M14 family metallopeptidase [Pedobacter immunditicola]|uniref:M14 family metallopeptidase n=1 Tax=Pedobacter immunditicola TaxID=3133440 RepID=UPI0030AC03BC